MSFETTDTSELIDRYKSLVPDYQKLSLELASCLEKYGRVRKELQILLVEFKARGVNVEEIEVVLPE